MKRIYCLSAKIVQNYKKEWNYANILGKKIGRLSRAGLPPSKNQKINAN